LDKNARASPLIKLLSVFSACHNCVKEFSQVSDVLEQPLPTTIVCYTPVKLLEPITSHPTVCQIEIVSRKEVFFDVEFFEKPTKKSGMYSTLIVTP